MQNSQAKLIYEIKNFGKMKLVPLFKTSIDTSNEQKLFKYIIEVLSVLSVSTRLSLCN